jgi:predicted  nucleic acid-binding Zn-ribbon protein
MKTVLFLAVLFCAIALPALGELTDTDLNKIRLIINEEIEEAIKPIKADIVTLQTNVAWMRGKLENVDKQITHGTNVTYGLIALIVAAIVIPQIITLWRNVTDNSLEKRIKMIKQEMETLKQQIETLKQQRIVNP